MQTTQQPDEQNDRERNPDQPQEQAATHVVSSNQVIVSRCRMGNVLSRLSSRELTGLLLHRALDLLGGAFDPMLVPDASFHGIDADVLETCSQNAGSWGGLPRRVAAARNSQ